MTRLLFATALFLGAAAVTWMGASFVNADTLGLSVIAVIGLVYVIGCWELLQFRHATATLDSAVTEVSGRNTEKPLDLEKWLVRLHPALRTSVRLRIEGERVPLPSPVLTPYLVSLLVMLGLLGTFAGMVVTLKGAVAALEGTTTLDAIRAGLTAPIGGLSLAFGTSVAGVAASAMLGLMSTLSRRDRMISARHLDAIMPTVFREFSLVYSRQETYRALQLQSQGLPEITQKLHELTGQIARMSESVGESLVAGQSHFHESIVSSFRELTASVDKSLRDTLAQSGQLAGESIQPIMQEAMNVISTEVRAGTQAAYEQLQKTAQLQVDSLNRQFQQTASSIVTRMDDTCTHWIEKQSQEEIKRLENWTGSLDRIRDQTISSLTDNSATLASELRQTTDLQRQAIDSLSVDLETRSAGLLDEVRRLMESSEAMISARMRSEETWLADHEQRMKQVASVLKYELGELRDAESQRGAAAVEHLTRLEATVATHIGKLGMTLEEPMARLIETASETPRAAAEVIGRLRSEMSRNIERDNQLLEERQRVMKELHSLSDSLEKAATGQLAAVESLVSSSSEMLQSVGSRLSDSLHSEVARIAGMTELFAGSATDMASLGEAFGFAVNLYGESSEKLVEALDRIERSLDNATNRSDDQLAYYVAQAREVIDHSIMSQKEIFEEIRELGKNKTAEVI